MKTYKLSTSGVKAVTIGVIAILAHLITAKLIVVLAPMVGTIITVDGKQLLEIGTGISFDLDTVREVVFVQVAAALGGIWNAVKFYLNKYLPKAE